VPAAIGVNQLVVRRLLPWMAKKLEPAASCQCAGTSFIPTNSVKVPTAAPGVELAETVVFDRLMVRLFVRSLGHIIDHCALRQGDMQ
jgi:hypothetical protein